MNLPKITKTTLEYWVDDLNSVRMHADHPDFNELALHLILQNVFGIDAVQSQHMQNTAHRVIEYWRTLASDMSALRDLTRFENQPPVKGMVLVNHVPFHSACAHHLLPFEGHAYVGYLPDDWIAGLSKIPRAIEIHAKRPQTQEWLTRSLADWLYGWLHPHALVVVMDAVHTCTTCRGVEASGVVMSTSAVLGDAQRYETVKTEFYENIRPFRGGH